MSVDIVYTTRKGKLIMLTGVFADYNSQTRQAVYSEDRYCPDALKLKFQNNGKVVLLEAVCAEFWGYRQDLKYGLADDFYLRKVGGTILGMVK